MALHQYVHTCGTFSIMVCRKENPRGGENATDEGVKPLERQGALMGGLLEVWEPYNCGHKWIFLGRRIVSL